MQRSSAGFCRCFSSVSKIALFGLSLTSVWCAPAQSKRRPVASVKTSAVSLGRCDVSPRRCSAYQEAGFVEAYVEFVYATADELAAAYPHYVPYGAAAEVGRPQTQRSVSVRESLLRLACFSITEQELEALGDVFALPRPPPRKPPSPEQVAEFMKQLTGEEHPGDRLADAGADSGPNVSVGPWLLQPLLIPVRGIPRGCAAISRIPRALIEKLASATDAEALGRTWTTAIQATGPNLFGGLLEPLQPDPRSDVSAWTAIARDLIAFARLASCSSRDLYVEIAYDC